MHYAVTHPPARANLRTRGPAARGNPRARVRVAVAWRSANAALRSAWVSSAYWARTAPGGGWWDGVRPTAPRGSSVAHQVDLPLCNGTVRSPRAEILYGVALRRFRFTYCWSSSPSHGFGRKQQRRRQPAPPICAAKSRANPREAAAVLAGNCWAGPGNSQRHRRPRGAFRGRLAGGDVATVRVLPRGAHCWQWCCVR